MVHKFLQIQIAYIDTNKATQYVHYFWHWHSLSIHTFLSILNLRLTKQLIVWWTTISLVLPEHIGSMCCFIYASGTYWENSIHMFCSYLWMSLSQLMETKSKTKYLIFNFTFDLYHSHIVHYNLFNSIITCTKGPIITLSFWGERGQ